MVTKYEQDSVCMDGPWVGQTLFLSTKETGIFTVNGQTGRYVKDPVENNLYWEKQNNECPI